MFLFLQKKCLFCKALLLKLVAMKTSTLAQIITKTLKCSQINFRRG